MTIEPEIATLKTLEAVLAWQASRQLRGDALSVVTQDEFNHDVVLADHKRWVVFGVT